MLERMNEILVMYEEYKFGKSLKHLKSWQIKRILDTSNIHMIFSLDGHLYDIFLELKLENGLHYSEITVLEDGKVEGYAQYFRKLKKRLEEMKEEL